VGRRSPESFLVLGEHTEASIRRGLSTANPAVVTVDGGDGQPAVL